MFNLLADIGAFDFAKIFKNIVSEWYYYVALLGFLALLVLFFVLKKPYPLNNLTRTQKLVYVSVLTAISTALNVLTYYPVSYIAISFTMTVCFTAGVLLGAKAGFAVGFIGDLIGAILFPAGPYNPLIGIASGLMGLIPGIIFQYFKGNLYVKTAISAVICLILCTSGLNTFALWLMYGLGKKTFWAYLIVRLPWQVLVAAINCALCYGILAVFKKAFANGRFTLFAKEQQTE